MRVRIARRSPFGQVAAVVVLVVLVAGSCVGGGSDGGDDPGGGDRNRDGLQGQPGDDIVLVGALSTFDACDEVLDYVVTHALDMVGPWGLGGGYGYAIADGREAAAMEAQSADSASGGRAAGPVEGVDYSGTNVQEAGVDESDIVKTDGERLFLVRGEWLDVVEVSDGTPELVSSVRLGGWGAQLLLKDDRLLVLGTGEGRAIPLAGGVARDAAYPAYTGTQLSLYDVTDPADPELVSTLQLDGRVTSARLIDGVARVVLRADPVGLPFVTPEGSGLRAERKATERNREIVADSTIDNWVPYYVHEVDGQPEEGTLLPCDRVHHPKEFAGLGTTSVLSLDLAGDLSPQGTTGVLAGGETVYASAQRLYVATNRWVAWEALSEGEAREEDERYTTELHAFDITDPDAARYVGSGSVRGHVLNQWSMSAHDGVLRVATTEGSPWREELRNNDQPASESFVTTFAEEDGELVELGQVGGLGEDERIYAVRFLGDLGYVVTFRETDPLYTIDLSDPSDPKVMGELKILGYSAYLHPLGDGLVLGVGQDADEQGRTQGLQLSLFDTSDLTEPKRIDQVTVADGHSGVEWDHHAFLHWPATGLTVIPYMTWNWDEKAETEEVTNGALAYTLDAEKTSLSELGRLTHLPEDQVGGNNPRYSDTAWRAAISRSMVIGDALYTVSDLGVKASDLMSLAELGWVTLPAR